MMDPANHHCCTGEELEERMGSKQLHRFPSIDPHMATRLPVLLLVELAEGGEFLHRPL